MEVHRIPFDASWELGRNISESVRCSSLSKKKFMQTNNQTLLRHTSSNKTKRAASCYIVQQDMKWLLPSRLSLLPSSPTRKKLFCLFVFTRQREAEAFKTWAETKRLLQLILQKTIASCESSFVYERGTIDLDTAVLVQHQKPRLAVKLSHIYTTRTTTKHN